MIQFVEIVRKCEHDEEEAPVEMAIDHCIRNHILEDFLRERRAEVLKAMTIDEFNPSRPSEHPKSGSRVFLCIYPYEPYAGILQDIPREHAGLKEPSDHTGRYGSCRLQGCFMIDNATKADKKN